MNVRTVVFALSALAALGATPAFAQDAPSVELSGGWRLLHTEGSTLNQGFYFDGAGSLDETIAIVGEFARATDSESESDVISGIPVTATATINIDSYLAGFRVAVRRNPHVVPFVQVLSGVVRTAVIVEGSATSGGRTVTVNESESLVNGALEFGGGVNLFFSRAAGVRIQASYLRVLGSDEIDGSNVLRFGVGFVAAF